MRGAQQGFTLIEALVALMILGVILSAVVPSFITNARINGRSELRAQAASAIEEVMDARRALPINTTTFPMSGSTEETVVVGSRTYTVKLTFCKQSSYCTSDRRMITAEARSGTDVLMTVETILTEVK